LEAVIASGLGELYTLMEEISQFLSLISTCESVDILYSCAPYIFQCLQSHYLLKSWRYYAMVAKQHFHSSFT